MFKPDKFISLLYRDHSKASMSVPPKNIDEYYLVAQMPIAEMFGKTAPELVEEIGMFTESPEWKSTNKRSICIGDIICIGYAAYFSVTAEHIPSDDWERLKPVKLPGAAVRINNDVTREIYIVRIETNDKLKDIICRSCQKT